MNNRLMNEESNLIDIDAIIEAERKVIQFKVNGKIFDMGVITIGDVFKIESIMKEAEELPEIELIRAILIYLLNEEAVDYIFKNATVPAIEKIFGLVMEAIVSTSGSLEIEESEKKQLEEEGFKENHIELKNGNIIKIPSRDE